MKDKIARYFLKHLGFRINLENVCSSDCILAVDDKYLTSYDVRELLESTSRYKYSYDMVVSLYNNLIAKWLIGDPVIYNTQWGIERKGDVCTSTPIKICKPFTEGHYKCPYTYGTLQMYPYVLVTMLKDKIYTEMVFTLWLNLREKYKVLEHNGINLFKEDLVTYNQCTKFLHERLIDLDIVFIQSFYRDVDFVNYIKNKYPKVYEKLSTTSTEYIHQVMSIEELVRLLKDYILKENT